MRLTKPYYALAASVAAAAVSVPIAYHYLGPYSAAKNTSHQVAQERKHASTQPSTTVGAVPYSGASGIQSLLTPHSRPSMDMRTARSKLAAAGQGHRNRPGYTGPANLMGRSAATAVSQGVRPLRVGALSTGSRQVSNQLVRHRRDDAARVMPREEHRDRFANFKTSPIKSVAQAPVSTFSADVDTASYAFVRRALMAGRVPPKDAVRVEELINYFTYNYAGPEQASEPFRPTLTLMPSPWNANTRLLHIAIKGYELNSAERPKANLVLLIDVSGSMGPADRLPLLKNAFKLLLDKLQPEDTVGIVTYASGSGVVLEPTKVAEKAKIVAAIDGLRAGGSTAGAQGIQDAYRLAQAGFQKDAVNRVILGTDGDFNVGMTSRQMLQDFIELKRRSGIFLSILGVGRGNYNDALMQTLAQNGNGTAAYIDTLNEARKVLIDEASSTLFPIAKDVKIQIEFNPAVVREYRLIGYETRALRREDFNNDKVDAGEVGSGHTMTAIYEITPAGAPVKTVDDFRYAQPVATKPQPAPSQDAKAGELGFLKLRYKLPSEASSRLQSVAIKSADELKSIYQASNDVRFVVAVAAFGQLLKSDPWIAKYSYDDVVALAQQAKGADPYGLRAEFINLVRLAKAAQP